MQCVGALDKRTGGVGVFNTKEFRQQRGVVKHRFQHFEALFKALGVVAQGYNINAGLFQFLARLLLNEAAFAELTQNVAQSDTALAGFFTGFVKYLDCGVGFLEADICSLGGHAALLERGADCRKLRGACLSGRRHYVHHSRHFPGCCRRVLHAHPVLVHRRGKHLSRRHAVPAHQLAGRLYAVAHLPERVRIFTQFRREL